MNDEMEFLGWDDEVEAGNPFIVLPEGDYPFVVTNFERAVYEKPANRETKVPANAPMAIVTLEVSAPTGGKVTLIENFYLYKKMQWKINQFFTSIGAPKNSNGTVKMNWNTVLGATGIAKVTVNNYKDRAGNDKQNNRVDTFNEPTQTTAANYQAPQQTASQQPPVTPFPGATPQQPQAQTGGYNFGG
jgi:hypothetical protein